MGSLRYKQRPAYFALTAALFVLVFGTWLAFGLQQRVDEGVGTFSSVLLSIFSTVGIAGMLMVLAFARYQFTHLWKHPDPASAKKNKHAGHRSSQGKDKKKS